MISSANVVSAYLLGREGAGPAPTAPLPPPSQAAAAFEQAMEQADRTAVAAMTGTAGTQELVQAITEAELALDTVVAIRDKIVEAYQEILRMPV